MTLAILHTRRRVSIHHRGNDFAAVPTVTGRDIAHRPRTVAQRALLAADLLAGKIRVEGLTQLQIAAVCRVSVPSIQMAKRINGNTVIRDKIASGVALNAVMPASNGVVAAWTQASASELAGLGRIVGVDEVWNKAIVPAID